MSILKRDGVTVVEWAHLIEEQLPNEYIQINIYHENETTRKILRKSDRQSVR